MKIAFAGRNILKPRGGAEVSAYILLRELSKSHQVVLFEAVDNISASNEDYEFFEKYEWILPKIHQWRIVPYEMRCLTFDLLFNRELKKWCSYTEPDMIIMQHFFTTVVSRTKIPTIFFIRDDSAINLSAPWLSRFYNMPFAALRRKQIRRADLVVANSKFVSEILRRFRIQNEIIYPFIEMKQYKIDGKFDSKYITFIRPEPWKGLEIALSIAKRMPEEHFLFVGNMDPNLPNRISEHKNITLLEWCTDMREVYRKTKIVIMPSMWDEPFGRVPIEAGINGIPTVASNRGGLSESVGDGGILIDNPYDISAWLSALQKIESDKNHFSKKAIKHSEKFSFDKGYKKFKEIVRKNLHFEI